MANRLMIGRLSKMLKSQEDTSMLAIINRINSKEMAYLNQEKANMFILDCSAKDYQHVITH
jgi:hypothetical protein